MAESPQRATSGEGGFSLIELLVAISLFSVVMMALTAVFISASRSVNDQRLRTAATRVATGHLETMRSSLFSQLDAAAGVSSACTGTQIDQPVLAMPLETVCRTVTTAAGRIFPVETKVTSIDAATGQPAAGGRVKRITVNVSWGSGGTARSVSYSTAVAPDDPRAAPAAQTIAAVAMAPSPTVTDAGGRPLSDLAVTVVMAGFEATTLVHLSWANADGTVGAKILTRAAGANWEGTVAKELVLAAIDGVSGSGEMRFNVSAGSAAVTVYTLSLQRVVVSPPLITGATISPNPVTVGKPATKKSCGDANQCENTTEVVFTVTADGLDPAKGDSVIVAYQLHDGTFQEKPLTEAAGQWRLTVRQRTTKFLTGIARPFRVTAIRSADGASAATTVLRGVVST